MKKLLLAAALMAGIYIGDGGTATVQAQSNRNCGDRETIISRLEDRYGEHRLGGGLTSTNGILEIYVSPDSGSWTVLITLPTGMSCLVAAGQSWESAGEALIPSGSPA